MFDRDIPHGHNKRGASWGQKRSISQAATSPNTPPANAAAAVQNSQHGEAGTSGSAAQQQPQHQRGPPKFRRQRLSRRASTGALRLTPDGGNQGRQPRKRAKVCLFSLLCVYLIVNTVHHAAFYVHILPPSLIHQCVHYDTALSTSQYYRPSGFPDPSLFLRGCELYLYGFVYASRIALRSSNDG